VDNTLVELILILMITFNV